MRRIEIGYLCRKGHFCWYRGDREEDGSCGAPGMGRIWLEVEPDWDMEDEDMEYVNEALFEAERNLAEKYEAWRAS